MQASLERGLLRQVLWASRRKETGSEELREHAHLLTGRALLVG